ncbi:AI-2E family transporter [Vibrio sp. SS-MA-C1-2]|uniref:AI-2E family transporter n=1 Tax=Vibrio sp. SS-MA-C1-2 TaxID=2908646 RepID=UPI001F39F243|nr:AI-2E family transporter [Vibrio sp. SS-MA-C1-2]UJF19784.1 AI-2E family transporter [Vibrio sp. SS-MA-C1-2]
MMEMFTRWYRRRFSDPDAVALVLIILVGALVVYFLGGLLAPLFAAIVLAYLLEAPVAKLSKLGLPRSLSTTLTLLLFVGVMLLAVFGLVPTIWHQVANFIADLPNMFNDLQHFAVSLPERYPELIAPHVVVSVMDTARDKLLGLGESVVKGSVSSLINIASLGVYLILVPLLAFFLLKDKNEMLRNVTDLLPKNRRLANRVGSEMNQQISNYIRGKVTEIIIVGGVSYVVFSVMDLRYTALLSVAIGLSVLIPYIGAAAVTAPVAMVALFQWGISPEFWWLLSAYMLIQILDGNVLVPILFSEAVNLHPVWIIVAVLFFGGLWGVWGVFFAIPLATLVKAVWTALSVHDEKKPLSHEQKVLARISDNSEK